MDQKSFKVVYKLRVLGHFVPWDIFGLEGIKRFCLLRRILGFGVLGHFGLKNQTRKTEKFSKILNYIKFSCSNCCSTFPKYMSFTKSIEIFRSKNIWAFK